MKLKYNAESEIGSIIEKDDIFAVISELEKFKTEHYNHHEIIERFEGAFLKRINAKYAISVSSCAAGIDMVLKSLSLKSTDEVLSCAINFHGTHLSIVNTGAKLILVEANQDLNIDIDDLKQKITPNTKAIVITHMNGVSCDMNSIKKLTQGTNIKIIEDAARSLGGQYSGSEIGEDSWACVFSFQYKKMITTLGEGGMIVTNDEKLCEELRKYRSFGLGEGWGTNYKMTSVQAAMGISQLKKLDDLVKKRRSLAHYRTRCLKEDTNFEKFVFPLDNRMFYNVYYLYTLLVPNNWNKALRDELILMLKDQGVECVIANPPTYQKNKYLNLLCHSPEMKKSERIGERIICLPIHPNMSNEENQYIVDILIESVIYLNGKKEKVSL